MHTNQLTINKPMIARYFAAFAMVVGLIAISPGITEAKGHHGHKPSHHERGYGPGKHGHDHGYWHDDQYGNHHQYRHDYRHNNRRYHAWEAERRKRAHRYASRAVDQAREAQWYGFYSDHPRWRTGYKRHFRWAMDARPDKIRSEIRKRERKLNELRHDARFGRHYRGHDPRDHYGPYRRHH